MKQTVNLDAVKAYVKRNDDIDFRVVPWDVASPHFAYLLARLDAYEAEVERLREALRDIQHRCWHGDPMNLAPDVNEIAAQALVLDFGAVGGTQ